jgi:beta-galactosidase
VTYDEFSNGRTPLAVTGTDTLPLPPKARALHWADGLRPRGAEPLAAYDHPHFGRWPAATTHRHGAGRITYVGTVPDPVFARALFAWAAPADAWRPAHPSVTATSAVSRDGRRVRFLHNWSWDQVSVPVPGTVRDVLSGEAYADAVPLGPWDVKVLRA